MHIITEVTNLQNSTMKWKKKIMKEQKVNGTGKRNKGNSRKENCMYFISSYFLSCLAISKDNTKNSNINF